MRSMFMRKIEFMKLLPMIGPRNPQIFFPRPIEDRPNILVVSIAQFPHKFHEKNHRQIKFNNNTFRFSSDIHDSVRIFSWKQDDNQNQSSFLEVPFYNGRFFPLDIPGPFRFLRETGMSAYELNISHHLGISPILNVPINS